MTRSPQGLYNWAACDVTNPILSPLLSLTFQVISGTPQIFRLLNPRNKKCYYATQYFNFSVTQEGSCVTLLRYGLKILTDSWIEGDSLGYPDHPPRRCHPECQSTFIHFFTNTLKGLHGRLAGYTGSATNPGHPPACPAVIFLVKLNLVSWMHFQLITLAAKGFWHQQKNGLDCGEK